MAETQSKAAAKAAASTVDGQPDRPGEDYRQEWADANGVDPSEMHEIHYPGGWVDRFDGRGWVRDGGSW